MLKKIVVLLCTLCVVSKFDAYNLDFGSKDSTIQLGAGSNFIIENPMYGVYGNIIKNSDATMEAAEMFFENGSFTDGNNKLKTSGTLSLGANDKVVLDGNKVFSGKRGSLYQSILISGKNNKIEGELTVSNDIVLNDYNSTVSVDLLSNLKGNIYLNGGSLYMVENNLKFDDHRQIVGPGSVYINGNKLIFGSKSLSFETPLRFVDAADLSFLDNINLASIWSFSGASILEGNISILNLEDGGQIIVEKNSSILMKNLILYGVHDGALFCFDNTCSITFQNVDIYLDGDFTFSLGHFEVLNKLNIHGDYKFIYGSSLQSKVLSKSTLLLDDGVTFSYDPGVGSKDLLMLECHYSTIKLDGATLHSTLTGMTLKTGVISIISNSKISSEKSNLLDEGISFGNDLAAEDLRVKFLRGASLELLFGSLKYRNVVSSSWSMGNNLSSLDIDVGGALYLYQDLNLGAGKLNYKGRGYLYYSDSKKLSGSVSVSGYLDHLETTTYLAAT